MTIYGLFFIFMSSFLVVYIFCNSWSLFTLRDLSNALNLKTYFKVIIFFAYPSLVCTNYGLDPNSTLYFCHWSFIGTQLHLAFPSVWLFRAAGQLLAVTETMACRVWNTYYFPLFAENVCQPQIKMCPGSFQSRFKEPLEFIKLWEIPTGGHLVQEAWRYVL